MSKAKNILLWCACVLALVGVAYLGMSLAASAMAEVKLKEFFSGMQDIARAEYSDVEVNFFTMSTTIRDLHIEIVGGSGFNIDEFELSRFEHIGGVPVSVAVSVRGAHLSLAQEPLAAQAERIRELGYDLLVLDYNMDFDYDQDSRRFVLDDLMLRVRDAGELGVSLNLSNVDFESLLAGGPSVMFMAVDQGELRYEDHSLVGRILESLAAEEQVSPEEVVETLDLGLLESEKLAVGNGDEFSAVLLRCVRSFLKKPGAISLHADPAKPVAIMQLMLLDDPLEVFRALNLHATVGKN